MISAILKVLFQFLPASFTFNTNVGLINTVKTVHKHAIKVDHIVKTVR